jgi:hypothetical protein
MSGVSILFNLFYQYLFGLDTKKFNVNDNIYRKKKENDSGFEVIGNHQIAVSTSRCQ